MHLFISLLKVIVISNGPNIAQVQKLDSVITPKKAHYTETISLGIELLADEAHRVSNHKII